MNSHIEKFVVSSEMGRRAGSTGWGWGLLVVLGILSVSYTLLGIFCLAFNTDFSYPIDLKLRWIEERLVWQGIDPQLVWQGIDPQGSGHPGAEYQSRSGGSYPPWAYVTGLVLIPPLPWRFTLCYATVLYSVALGIIGGWAWNQGRVFGRIWAWVSLCCSLSLFPTAVCVSYGQYGATIAGGLAAMDLLLERRKLWGDIVAGIILGVILVKPQLSGLFAFAVLLEGRWICVTTCGAYLAAATGILCYMLGTHPMDMINNSLYEASYNSFLSQNPIMNFARGWFGFHSATAILGICGLLVTLFLIVPTRLSPRLLRWSVCSIVSMFWSYRRHYDVPILLFPLIALLLAALNRRSKILWGGFTIFGLTVWAPIRIVQWTLPEIQMIDLIVWTAGLGLLLWWGLHRSNDDAGRKNCCCMGPQLLSKSLD